MKTHVKISAAAWDALHALAHEYLAKGGALRGVTTEVVEEALDALANADRIERED